MQLRIDGAIGGGRISRRGRRGDVNGDGRGDVVVGAPQETARGRSGSGSAYVIFGTESPTRSTSPRSARAGFVVDGAADGDRLGTAVGGAGDVNGDGLADVVLGAPEADAHGRAAWARPSSCSDDEKRRGLRRPRGARGAGFRIDGAAALDNAGAAVAGAGRERRRARRRGGGRAAAGNNDRPGLGLGARQSRHGSAAIDLAALGGAGFRIDGAAALDNAGAAVADAGT